MSQFCVELVRTNEDSLSLPAEDYQAIARGTVLPLHPEGETIPAEDAETIADTVADRLPGSWDAETNSEFLSFLGRGAFSVSTECLGFPAEHLD